MKESKQAPAQELSILEKRKRALEHIEKLEQERKKKEKALALAQLREQKQAQQEKNKQARELALVKQSQSRVLVSSRALALARALARKSSSAQAQAKAQARAQARVRAQYIMRASYQAQAPAPARAYKSSSAQAQAQLYSIRVYAQSIARERAQALAQYNERKAHKAVTIAQAPALAHYISQVKREIALDRQAKERAQERAQKQAQEQARKKAHLDKLAQERAQARAQEKKEQEKRELARLRALEKKEEQERAQSIQLEKEKTLAQARAHRKELLYYHVIKSLRAQTCLGDSKFIDLMIFEQESSQFTSKYDELMRLWALVGESVLAGDESARYYSLGVNCLCKLSQVIAYSIIKRLLERSYNEKIDTMYKSFWNSAKSMDKNIIHKKSSDNITLGDESDLVQLARLQLLIESYSCMKEHNIINLELVNIYNEMSKQTFTHLIENLQMQERERLYIVNVFKQVRAYITDSKSGIAPLSHTYFNIISLDELVESAPAHALDRELYIRAHKYYDVRSLDDMRAFDKKVGELMSACNERQASTLNKRLMGYSQELIAETEHVSQQAISKRMKVVGEKAMELDIFKRDEKVYDDELDPTRALWVNNDSYHDEELSHDIDISPIFFYNYDTKECNDGYKPRELSSVHELTLGDERKLGDVARVIECAPSYNFMK